MLRVILGHYVAAASLAIVGLIPTTFGQSAPATSTVTYEIIADWMCCQGCAKKVAAQLYTAPGVINVKADVPNRIVTVTAKPSPKLTFEKLWHAVEQAKGEPSRLSTSEATFTLTPANQLKPEDRVGAGQHKLLIAEMNEMERAQKVAGKLRAIRGVENLSVDLTKGALFVKPAAKVQLSPFALAAAVEQAEESVISVTGPYGRLSIEPVEQQAARAALSSRQPTQGTVQ